MKAGNKENKEQYRRIATDRNEKNCNKVPIWTEEIVKITEKMTKENQNIHGKIGDKDKKKIQNEIDLRYDKITKELLAIEKDQKIWRKNNET